MEKESKIRSLLRFAGLRTGSGVGDYLQLAGRPEMWLVYLLFGTGLAAFGRLATGEESTMSQTFHWFIDMVETILTNPWALVLLIPASIILFWRGVQKVAQENQVALQKETEIRKMAITEAKELFATSFAELDAIRTEIPEKVFKQQQDVISLLMKPVGELATMIIYATKLRSMIPNLTPPEQVKNLQKTYRADVSRSMDGEIFDIEKRMELFRRQFQDFWQTNKEYPNIKSTKMDFIREQPTEVEMDLESKRKYFSILYDRDNFEEEAKQTLAYFDRQIHSLLTSIIGRPLGE